MFSTKRGILGFQHRSNLQETNLCLRSLFEAEKLKKLTDSVDETGDGDLVKTVSPFPIRR